MKRKFIKTAITRGNPIHPDLHNAAASLFEQYCSFVAENNEPFYEFAFNSSMQDSNCILIDQVSESQCWGEGGGGRGAVGGGGEIIVIICFRSCTPW